MKGLFLGVQEIASLVLPVIKAVPEAVPSEANTYLARAEADVSRSKLQYLLECTQKMATVADSYLDE